MDSKINNLNHNHINGIVCDVTNCRYNGEDRCCTAKEIKVGPQFANTSDDTACATFKPGSVVM